MNGMIRTIARLAAVAAVALVLVGFGAEVAKAEKVSDFSSAGDFKIHCEILGGTFSTDSFGANICKYPDGAETRCFENGKACWHVRAPKVSEPAPNRGVGVVANEGSVLDGGGVIDLNEEIGGGVLAGEAEAQR